MSEPVVPATHAAAQAVGLAIPDAAVLVRTPFSDLVNAPTAAVAAVASRVTVSVAHTAPAGVNESYEVGLHVKSGEETPIMDATLSVSLAAADPSAAVPGALITDQGPRLQITSDFGTIQVGAW